MCEQELIERVKNNDDNAALQELVALHTGVLHQICRKNSIPDRPLVNFEEQFANRFKITYDACKTYSLNSLYKFVTHLGNQTKWKCIENIEDLMEKEECSYDPQELTSLKDFNCLYEDKHDNIEEYIKMVSDSQTARVLRMRFIDRMTWLDISKELKFSHTRIQQICQTGLDIIKKKLKSKLAAL